MKFLFTQLFLAIFILLLPLSCTERKEFNKPHFNQTEEREFEILTDELIGKNVINDLFYYKDNLVVVAYDAENGKYLHTFNLNGKETCSTLFRGRGAKEILFPVNHSFDKNTGELMFVDNISKKYVSLSVDSLIVSGETKGVAYQGLLMRLPIKAEKANNGYLLMDTDYDLMMNGTENKFVLINDNLDTLSVYNEYPYKTDPAHRYQQHFFSAKLDVLADGKRFAFVPFLGAILETYAIEDGQIKPLAVGKFIEPQFDIVEKTSWDFNDDSVIGFDDVFVTDDYIYTVYDGETRPQTKEVKSHLWETNIAVFDWNCKPVKLIKTDYRISCLCIDEKEEYIYAVVSDINKINFLGRIRL